MGLPIMKVAAVLVLLGPLLLAACVGQSETNPYPPAPAPMSEVIPKPPVSATPLIWQPGHWDWNGTAYVWAPGQYVPAEGHGSMWLPGYWQKTEAGWQWQPAHWTS